MAHLSFHSLCDGAADHLIHHEGHCAAAFVRESFIFDERCAGAHTHGVTYAAQGISVTTGSAGAHTHGVPNAKTTLTTGSAGAHTHTRGTMNITGRVPTGARFFKNNGSDGWTDGAFSLWQRHEQDGDTSGDSGGIFNFTASRAWTGHTSSDGAHTHSITINANTMTAGSNGAHTHGISFTIPAQGMTTGSSGAHTHNLSGTTASAGSHTHAITVQTAGVHQHNVTVNNAGGNASFNIMPPYIAVNVWKRTAKGVNAMANQPDIIPSAWAANNSTTETIPATTTESGKASWDQGFPVETSLPLSQGGIPPKYGDFNGVLNVLSQFCLFAQSGGQYAWVNSLDYSVGSIVLGTDGSIYRAAQVSGPSTAAVNPVGDTSGKWERIVSKSDIDALEEDIQNAMDAASDAASNASAAQSAVTTLDANVVKLSGAQEITGAKTFTSDISANKSNFIIKNIISGNTGEIGVEGGNGYANGAYLVLYGASHANRPGQFRLNTTNGGKALIGDTDGTLSWDGNIKLISSVSTSILLIPILPRILSTSYGCNGVGLAPLPLDPMKPVTPGVLRTTYQASSDITISTKM